MSDQHRGEAVLQAIDLLAPALEKSGVDELEVSAGELHVRLTRRRAEPLPPAAVAPIVASQPAPGASTPFGEPSQGMRFVTAPLTGLWYSAPSPGARPYLSEGAEVSNGQVVGLIEAMKLFNEIKSDVAGKVVRILAEDGSLVKRQQPLLEVDPR